jgi:hypothetical protein
MQYVGIMMTMLATQFDWGKVAPVCLKPPCMVHAVDSIEIPLAPAGDFVVVGLSFLSSRKSHLFFIK